MSTLFSRRDFIKASAVAAGLQATAGRARVVAQSARTGARDMRSKPYSFEDFRFTAKGDALYAYLLAPQPAKQAAIKSLATNSPYIGGRKVKDVTILGGGKMEWSQDEQGLSVKLPERLLSSEAVGLRISGVL